MSEREERRRNRLSTGIFHQPKDEPDHIIFAPPEDVEPVPWSNCCRKCGERIKTSVVALDLCGSCADENVNGKP